MKQGYIEISSIIRDYAAMKNGMEVMLNLLTTMNDEWMNSVETLAVLKPPLMRLCVRYCSFFFFCCQRTTKSGVFLFAANHQNVNLKLVGK